jgi:uncharacterized tellurite resistance protein B-like protein
MVTMLDAIRALFGTNKSVQATTTPHSPGPAPDPVHVAACALLLEIAHADGEFSDSECAHLEHVLERHFALSADSGRALMDLAEKERQNAIDHFHFTSVLQQNYSTGQKMVLAEAMWGLVLADGQVAEHEHYLTRKISNLLGLEPGYLSAAKAAAARAQEL